MTESATVLNPEILVWARKRAGLSIEEVAQKLRRSPSDISSWEQGQQAPTYIQLERLAYSVYKRPIAIFFFPQPPNEPDPETSFRTLPSSAIDSFDSDTRYAIREALAFQMSLKEITGGANPSARLITRAIAGPAASGPVQLARQVRKYLGVTLETQTSWKSSSEAMENWRDVVEGCGVFARKRSFKQQHISGFCLADDEFPVIVINNSTSFTRQIFTLFHELSHLLYGVSGITTRDSSRDDDSSGAAEVERACNQFAAEFLLPTEALNLRAFDGLTDEGLGIAVAKVAGRFHVSREAVLRRLLDAHLVTTRVYQKFADDWNQDYERAAESAGGGNFYSTQVAYLGKAFLNMAFSQYHDGKLDLLQVADYLGVKAAHVDQIETLFRRKIT